MTILDFILATFHRASYMKEKALGHVTYSQEEKPQAHTASTTAIRTHPTLPGALLSFDLCNNVFFPGNRFSSSSQPIDYRTLFWVLRYWLK